MTEVVKSEGGLIYSGVPLQGASSGQTLAFDDFDFLSSAVFSRCTGSSATFAAAEAKLGRQWK